MSGTVPFHKGQKIGGVSANALNRTFDAATRPRVHPMIHSERPTPMPANNIILGVNRTGRFLQTGDVVRVSKVLSDPYTLAEDLYFEFELPSKESSVTDMYGNEMTSSDSAPSLAVVRCGGDNRDPVYASAYGRELARMQIEDLEHRYADIEENSTILKSCEYGPFMLLGRPSTRWIEYWPVIFPSGGQAPPEAGEGGGVEGGGSFSYALGVVTGAGAYENTVGVRIVDQRRSIGGTVVIADEEIEACVWPETFGHEIRNQGNQVAY